MWDYPSSSPNVISAVRVYNATNAAGTQGTTTVLSSTVASSSGPSVVFVTPSASSVPSGDLCPSYNFTTYADNEDNNWQVLCGFDTSPSSFSVVDVPNFASCLEACEAEDECVAVSYFGTGCYFKNGYQGMVPSANVNSAFIINQANYPVPSRDEVYAGRGCGSSLPAGQLPGGPTTQFFINSAGLNRSLVFMCHLLTIPTVQLP